MIAPHLWHAFSALLAVLVSLLLAPCRTTSNVLSLPDASTKLLRFVSDDIWGSRGRCRVISRSIAEYLVQAWDVHNSCKHNGAVLPLPSAPEGRGADGVDAMA
jgi:hypothetical protein